MPYFRVLPLDGRVDTSICDKAYLLTDNWDDWFKYSTLYSLIIVDENGDRHLIGGVKIGQFEMAEGQRRPNLPTEFDNLDGSFFSLGQDDSYYDALNNLGSVIRERVLKSLRDIALNSNVFEKAISENVTGTSLLRSVDRATVIGQFRRMALGGARLTNYEFSYTARQRSENVRPLSLNFKVAPESYPPTNVHVLIGRNGVGKTTLLNDMSRAIVEKGSDIAKVGAFSGGSSIVQGSIFAGLVSVTFSAFDPFEPLPQREDKSEDVRYAYIGLKHSGKDRYGKEQPPKNPDELTVDFVNSAIICRHGAKTARWQRALEMLQSDPIFRDAKVSLLARSDVKQDLLQDNASVIFKNLSSGHKIVLLTITRLVETVEEKTLVLLDEPEAHLHPPLLSAFIRALSDLLINRNGVAIIATHSPVVLQEVPASCVWMVRRSGIKAIADRPMVQTFGENVGLLTSEVFGLEVTESGFHKMLKDSVAELPSYEAIVRRFHGELGYEARAIVQGLIAARDNVEGGDY